MFVSMNFWINVGFDIIFNNYVILYLFLNFLNMELLIIIVIFPNLVNMVDAYVYILINKYIENHRGLAVKFQEKEIILKLEYFFHPELTRRQRLTYFPLSVYYKTNALTLF
jgi:hypothetical protein